MISENASFFLSEHRIDFHLQIVVTPGWNDGIELENTLFELLKPQYNTLSVGIVPIGLTRFRSNLTPINPMKPEQAAQIIHQIDAIRKKAPTSIVYCADELYCKCNVPIPPNSYYDDYVQIQNGIGMLRLMLSTWKKKKKRFSAQLKKLDSQFLIITGVSAFPYIQTIANDLNEMLAQPRVRIQAIQNHYFGETVTVTGLLCYEDISQQIDIRENEILISSDAFLNHEQLTIDQHTLEEVVALSPTRSMILINELFEDWEFLHLD